MSGRLFLIDDDDTLRRISAKCFNGLINSDPAVTMREFAGRRVRYAVAIVETEQRRVICIRSVECGFFQFNEVGALDQKAWRDTLRAMSDVVSSLLHDRMDTTASTAPPSLTRAAHLFARRSFERPHQWKPTNAMVRQMATLLFNS